MMLRGMGATIPNSVMYGPAGGLYDGVTSIWDFFNTPTLTPPPSPVNSTPVAPQTGPAMVSWTPEQLAEASAQRGAQYASDASYFGGLLADKDQPSSVGLPSLPSSIELGTGSTLTWVLVAVAGVLFLTTVVKR